MQLDGSEVSLLHKAFPFGLLGFSILTHSLIYLAVTPIQSKGYSYPSLGWPCHALLLLSLLLC